MFFFISQWEWIQDDGQFMWSAPFPDQLISCIDLRPHNAQATAGDLPQGFGLFVYKTDVSSRGMLRIGTTDLEETLSSGVRRDIGTRTGFTVDSTRLKDLYWEFLLDKADVDSVSFSRPLMPTHDGVLSIEGVGNTKLTEKSRYWGKVLSAIHRIYEGVRTESRAGRVEEDLHRRLLGTWKLKFGIHNYEIFIPDHLPKERFLEPKTTITESFDTADSDTLGPDLTWTEVLGDIDIVSNEAATGTATLSRARAEHDLSSDDQRMQMFLTAATHNNTYLSSFVRYSSTEDTCYQGLHRNTISNKVVLQKIIAGVSTSLALANDARPSIPFINYLQCNGSSLIYSTDNVERFSITDTSIIGNTRTGFGFLGRNTDERGDDFEAADLINKRVTKSWMANSNSLPSQGPYIFG